jgi:hypothetical protein
MVPIGSLPWKKAHLSQSWPLRHISERHLRGWSHSSYICGDSMHWPSSEVSEVGWRASRSLVFTGHRGTEVRLHNVLRVLRVAHQGGWTEASLPAVAPAATVPVRRMSVARGLMQAIKPKQPIIKSQYTPGGPSRRRRHGGRQMHPATARVCRRDSVCGQCLLQQYPWRGSLHGGRSAAAAGVGLLHPSNRAVLPAPIQPARSHRLRKGAHDRQVVEAAGVPAPRLLLGVRPWARAPVVARLERAGQDLEAVQVVRL